MSPKKGTLANREPTVVYPDTSPQLMIAYRIFGPGHDKLDDLECQKTRIFKSRPIDGESVLTSLGQDIVKSLNVNVSQISAAYMRYEAEIKRMNKAERIHEKRKRAQFDGAGAEDEEEDEDDSDGDGVLEVDADGNVAGALKRGKSHVWDEDEDPYEQFYSDPALWITRENALARTRAMRATIAEMNKNLRTIQVFYNKKMESNMDLDQGVERSVHNLLAVTLYAEKLEHLIRLHDDMYPETCWKSRDRMNVTFGEKVPWTIHKIWDMEERLGDMKPVMTACKSTVTKLAKTNLITETKELRAGLRVKLVKFAALCLAEEARDDFKNELEEELKQMGRSCARGDGKGCGESGKRLC